MKRNDFIEILKIIGKTSLFVADDLLLAFGNLVEALSYAQTGRARYPFDLERLKEIENYEARNRLRRAIRQLENKKLIKIEKKGEGIIKALTKEGKMELRRLRIINNESRLPDNESCLVVFDIPEHLRKVRDKLRAFLKQANFKKIQRSVWISHFNVVDDMTKLVKEMKVDEWVSVFKGKRSI